MTNAPRILHISDGPSIFDPTEVAIVTELGYGAFGVKGNRYWNGWRAKLVRFLINRLLKAYKP